MSGIRIFSLAMLLLLAGCGQSSTRNVDDPLAFLAAGSQLQLTRELEIAAGETRVFFQRGKAISKGELDYYHPSCDLEVWELQQFARKISEDLFVLGKLTFGRQTVVSLGTTKLADNSLASRLFGDRGPTIHRFVRVELHSDAQPDVMRLTCRGAWADYYDARLPSDAEIKLALGNILVFL